MFYLKACTKCQGDLTLDKDAYGDFLKCMQRETLIDVKVGVQGHRSLLNEAGAQPLHRIQAKTAVAA